MRLLGLFPVIVLGAAVSACGGKSTPASPTPTAPAGPATLTRPAADTPPDGEQLDNVRPTLTVVNGTSNQSGAKTYEFQVSDTSTFAASAGVNMWFAATISSGAVPEDPSGKTKFVLAQDLQPTTKYYWRARLVQGSTNSDWSEMRTFNTKLVGYNRPGALYDPLVVSGETVGTISGARNATWAPGQGLTLNDMKTYVVYQLPQVISSGEFSMEVLGLHQGGPGGKPKIFQILDQTNAIPSSGSYAINAQYRGSPGNPDNCVAFKAVLGDKTNAVVEPDLAKRRQSVINPDPAKVYLWKGVWTPTSFRLVVKEGGAAGLTVYDYQMDASHGRWNPSAMFAYVGSNYAQFTGGDGTFPGITVRNVWLGSMPRPASLGTAIAPLR